MSVWLGINGQLINQSINKIRKSDVMNVIDTLQIILVFIYISNKAVKIIKNIIEIIPPHSLIRDQYHSTHL